MDLKASLLVHKHREKIEDAVFYVLKTGFRILLTALICHIINKYCLVFVNLNNGQAAGFRTSLGYVLITEVLNILIYLHFGNGSQDQK